jgi:hypothetical protein
LTYGLERLAMYVQGVDRVFDLNFNGREGDRKVTYGDVFLQAEKEYSRHNFEYADTAMLFEQFKMAEAACRKYIDAGWTTVGNARHHLMALPAYDQCIKASHVFNLLDARGVISVTERQSYILRVRELAKACGEAWLATDGRRSRLIAVVALRRRGHGLLARPVACGLAVSCWPTNTMSPLIRSWHFRAVRTFAAQIGDVQQGGHLQPGIARCDQKRCVLDLGVRALRPRAGNRARRQQCLHDRRGDGLHQAREFRFAHGERRFFVRLGVVGEHPRKPELGQRRLILFRRNRW